MPVNLCTPLSSLHATTAVLSYLELIAQNDRDHLFAAALESTEAIRPRVTTAGLKRLHTQKGCNSCAVSCKPVRTLFGSTANCMTSLMGQGLKITPGVTARKAKCRSASYTTAACHAVYCCDASAVNGMLFQHSMGRLCVWDGGLNDHPGCINGAASQCRGVQEPPASHHG